MRTFFEFRKSLVPKQSKPSEIENYSPQNFQEPQNLSVEIKEQIVNKAYALTQNSQFNSVRQKASSISASVKNLTQRVRAAEDQNEKIDRLADALDEINKMLILQCDLMMSIKNVTVADVILSDDLAKTIQKHFSKIK